MPNINDLLALNNAELHGLQGDVERARSRLAISREIWGNYIPFHMIRRNVEDGWKKHPTQLPHRDRKIDAFIMRLSEAGYIKEAGENRFEATDQDSYDYIMGEWLEELAYFAMWEADVDEIYFRQHIRWWTDSHDDDQEIDVIARRGDVLSFISCKTASPFYESKRDAKKFRTFLFEADYWEQHFAKGTGKVILLTTQDLIDEAHNNRPRAPNLFVRADVLEVDVIGCDYSYEDLVKKFREHWGP